MAEQTYEDFECVDIVRNTGINKDVTSLQVRHRPTGWSEVRAGRPSEHPNLSEEEFEGSLHRWAVERLQERLTARANRDQRGTVAKIPQEIYAEVMRRRVDQNSEDPAIVIGAAFKFLADTLYSRGVIDAGDAASRIRRTAQDVERELRRR